MTTPTLKDILTTGSTPFSSEDEKLITEAV
jgi:hypothetical protein